MKFALKREDHRLVDHEGRFRAASSQEAEQYYKCARHLLGKRCSRMLDGGARRSASSLFQRGSVNGRSHLATKRLNLLQSEAEVTK
jgi:hypothetical protein